MTQRERQRGFDQLAGIASSSRPYCVSHFFFLVVLVLGTVLDIVASQRIIKTLPGFPGTLPFKLETGYVGVGELDEIQLFYYFIESEISPEDDPLVLWLTGGPGCSAFSGLVYEIGPLAFIYSNWSSTTVPTLRLNPYSWTKLANIIFLDSPVGTGFSYATNWQTYHTSDTLTAAANYDFLRKWLMGHPKFLKNPLYVAGDSYSGIIVPIVVQEITNGNEVGVKPSMNLKGYVLGNSATTLHDDFNARVPFSHRMALLSDRLYKSANTNCKGEFINIDPANALCVKDMKVIDECLKYIEKSHVLEPWCPHRLSPKPMELNWYQSSDLFTEDHSIDHFLLSLPTQLQWCRDYNYISSYIWANDQIVQNALHIRKGSIKKWVRCNNSLSYTINVQTSFDYHQNFVNKNYRSLIYSGDHDMLIPYLGTHAWIEALNLTISIDWKPWFVDEQVAGYTMQYTEKNYQLTFATVKGAGHTAPEYKPKECLAMIERWFANYPL